MRLLKLLFTALLIPSLALAECDIIEFDNNSNIIRAKIIDTTDGQGLTGLSSASSGLRIAAIADNASATTAYTVAGSTIEGITTLGTYAAPTATKVRFKELDATNHPGIYEFQFSDATFSAASSKSILISASGATNMQEMDCHIPLVYSQSTVASNLLNTTVSELSALPSASAPTVGQMLRWLFQYGMGYYKATSTSSTKTLFKDDGTTSLGTCAVSDNGTTFTKSECS